MITTDTRELAPVPGSDATNKMEYFIKCPYCSGAQTRRLYNVREMGPQDSYLDTCDTADCGKNFVVGYRVDVQATSSKIEGQ